MKVIRNKLRFNLVLMAILPVTILGVFFVFFGIKTIRTVNEKEVMSSLEGVCLHLRDEFTEKYPGDYSIKDGKYYSGDVDISASEELLEDYKEQFKAEVTIFFDDERVLTTITDGNSKIIGTHQNDTRVLETVMSGGKFTSRDVQINGRPYYVCYIPLFEGNDVAGMVFAGISDENVSKSISSFLRTFISLTVVIMFVIVFITFSYSTQLANMLTSIKEYLGSLVEYGSSSSKMQEEVLERSDEVGDLGRYAVNVGGQLANIIGKDPLTGLYNRRAGRHLLDNLHDDYVESGCEYTLVMCDVDYFKNVNDTYGHNAGDAVLKEISRIVIETCDAYPGSFAIRWGGEEILIGFRLKKIYAVEAVEMIRDRLKSVSFNSDETTYNITVTFGVASNTGNKDLHGVIVAADEKLYLGKESGRDRIEV